MYLSRWQEVGYRKQGDKYETEIITGGKKRHVRMLWKRRIHEAETKEEKKAESKKYEEEEEEKE
jgi:hypothetical protein